LLNAYHLYGFASQLFSTTKRSRLPTQPRHPRPRPLQQFQPQTPFLRESDLLGDVGLCATASIGGPVLGQVESGVEQRLAAGSGVSEEDADLTVVEFTETTAPLPAEAARLDPLLGEAGSVEDEGAVVVADLVLDMAGEFVKEGVVIPAAGPEELLQGPTVLAGLSCEGFGGFATARGDFAASAVETMLMSLTMAVAAPVSRLRSSSCSSKGRNKALVREGL
jgi:hypothetical protein